MCGARDIWPIDWKQAVENTYSFKNATARSRICDGHLLVVQTPESVFFLGSNLQAVLGLFQFQVIYNSF